jgi:hypothetical protein
MEFIIPSQLIQKTFQFNRKHDLMTSAGIVA